MISFKFVSAMAVAAVFSVVATSAQAQSTIRIEPRPFYGATMSMEAGVRVIRPLPPERYVIINPDNATPLSLGIQDTRVYEKRNIHNYHYNKTERTSGGNFGGWGYGVGGYGRHHDGDGRGHHAGGHRPGHSIQVYRGGGGYGGGGGHRGGH